MIAEYNRAIVTDAGINLIARQFTEGKNIEFTRFAIGNGEYTEEEKAMNVVKTMTALKREKNSYQITSKSIFNDTTVKLKFTITNYDIVTGENIVPTTYSANEIGLFAKIDDETEVLFSIAICHDDYGDTISSYNGNNPIQILQTFNAVTSNADRVIINNSGAYALEEDLEDLSDSLSLHRTNGNIHITEDERILWNDEEEVTVTFNNDGTISESNSFGTKTTVFNNDGTITETYPSGRVLKTSFSQDGTVIERVLQLPVEL